MRELHVGKITDTVASLCVTANLVLPQDIRDLLEKGQAEETSPLGCKVLQNLCENYRIAERESLPICQDTGMAVVFADIGQDLHIIGGDFEAAVNLGVSNGYKEGYLRKSVVSDPLRRKNTDDNTPAIIHTRMVRGDRLAITVAPKGFGSENMSSLKMFLPTCGPCDIINFICDTVSTAGSNPCPPVILGVGLGGTVEGAALAAKRALCRPVSEKNPDPFYSNLEMETLERVNTLDIGPQGFGGKTTALAVNIEYLPTHIAGLPCVINMGCHATRHAKAVL